MYVAYDQETNHVLLFFNMHRVFGDVEQAEAGED
jgi:hypothetical protein